jgi:hypothetical protein
LKEDGQLGTIYHLFTRFGDIRLPYDNYADAFHEHATRRLEEVIEHNGVFVMVLHATYFGVFSYLRAPKNLIRSVRYIPTYLGRVWKLEEDQEKINVSE